MKINGSRWTDFLPYKYIKQIKMFSNADLNRMIVLSDKFQRSDARTIFKLFVAQGYLNKDDNSDENQSAGLMYSNEF